MLLLSPEVAKVEIEDLTVRQLATFFLLVVVGSQGRFPQAFLMQQLRMTFSFFPSVSRIKSAIDNPRVNVTDRANLMTVKTSHTKPNRGCGRGTPERTR